MVAGLQRGMNTTPKRGALSLIEVLVVIAALVVLALLLIPALQKARVRSDWGSCITRVKQIHLSFRLWAEDNGGAYPMQIPIANGGTREAVAGGNAAVHFRVLSNYLSVPRAVWCPQDTERTHAFTFSGDFDNSNVSYFVSVDATAASSNVVLVGDRKITVDGVRAATGFLTVFSSNTLGWARDIHGGRGNAVFVDGHAEQGGSQVISTAVSRSGTPRRLAIP